MSFRKEKKYRLTTSDFYSIKTSLSQLGMSRLFEPREITSLYYDNESLDMFHQSEEGVLPRRKVRLRWYDPSVNANMETKTSSIEGRFKTIKPLNQTNFGCHPRILSDQYYGSLTPSLLVSYQREYFSIDGMRLTFDSLIKYQDYRAFAAVKTLDPERVMEIKVGADVPDDYIETLIPWQTSRFSKYARGLLLCNRTDHHSYL